MRLRRFTREEDSRLNALRLIYTGGRGKGGIRKIGRIMGRHHRSIAERLKLLAEVEEGDRIPQIQRNWTDGEWTEAQELRAAGWRYAWIAKKLKRTPASVRHKFHRERWMP